MNNKYGFKETKGLIWNIYFYLWFYS
jgi:hypothetical protein